MLTGLLQHAHKVKFLLNDHSSTILTAVGVGGTVATAVLTGRASFKAADLIEDEKDHKAAEVNLKENKDEVTALSAMDIHLSKTEKVKLVWREYLPPVAMGVTTIASIIVANKITSRKIAALAVAGGISERALQEYKDKVVEKFGERKATDIRDEIAQDRVSANPAGSREIILAGTGEVLCFDMTTGRYFQSTVEEIKRAENKVNFELIHYMSCSLSFFYDEIGLPPTSYTDSVGWNMNNKMEVVFSTVMSQDGRPCLSVDFTRPPVADYNRTAWD